MQDPEALHESEYWSRLEYRVCQEFAGTHEGQLKRLWSDGFFPTRYSLHSNRPSIRGHAWIGSSRLLEKWTFSLVLNPRPSRQGKVNLPSDIIWKAQLPAENLTGWLAVDFDAAHLEINPGSALPALPQPEVFLSRRSRARS